MAEKRKAGSPSQLTFELVNAKLIKGKRQRDPSKARTPKGVIPPQLAGMQWKKGQSGNQNPKTGRSYAAYRNSCVERKDTLGLGVLSKAYKQHLTEQCILPGLEHLTWAEAVAYGIANAAVGGEVPAAKELREATEGKLPENLNVNAELSGALAIGAKQKLLGKLKRP